MNILFEEFPELKEAFDLKEEFRKLYWSKSYIQQASAYFNKLIKTTLLELI
jgi:hypothetical protein